MGIFHNNTALKQIDSVFMSRLEEITKILVFGYLGVVIAIGLIYQILSVAFPYPLDYGEAPLVDQAMRLLQGKNIYRASLAEPPYTISNYPPVYLILLAPLVKAFGPGFAAGRVLSTLSALSSALFIALITRTLTKDRLAAFASGMIFLTIPYVVKWSSYLRIDLLALALSLAGVYLLVCAPDDRRSLLGGALLLIGAIFTRQSYALAAPLAAFVYILFRNWSRALALAGIVGSISLVLFLVLNSLTRGGFYFNIVTANVNEFGMGRLEWNLRDLWHVAPVLLALGGCSLFLLFRWPPGKIPIWTFTTPYLLGASLSALTIGKIGSNINYFLELCAALSLAAGAVVAWSRKYQGSHLLRAVLFGLLIFQISRSVDKMLNQYIPELTERRSLLFSLRQLEKLVVDTPGPVLADEYMGMVTLAGRPLEIQPFEVTQLANAGRWDQTPLLERIRNKEFPMVLIWEPGIFPIYRERWTQAMLAAIDQNYFIEKEIASTRVYRPR